MHYNKWYCSELKFEKIKMLKNDYTFSVAPMMGVTTPSARFMYRLISKKVILFTEMIASQAIYRGDYDKFLKKDSIEEPVILQVGGSDNELLKFSTNLANKYNYQGINLNIVKTHLHGRCLQVMRI